MPNVDDHGLEVLKKAARDLDTPAKKRDYALQMILVKDESGGTVSFTPQILNLELPDAGVEVKLELPEDCKTFWFKARKVCRMKYAFVENGTVDGPYVLTTLGGGVEEIHRLNGVDVYIQSDVSDNFIDGMAYI